ncbi:hypothetical protein SAMN04487765_1135 [Tenacibaculum sp. MAR_2010_89]|uniref:hypothetical protein n=1 Tax=Tenacibaculum sp. MAR_2010_89 TaxID=1250198 RepID=UPI000895AE87|nr:hypothetical protein [Tenacibaculum sp. MAR_2010_89]SEE02305.1 hypothetical protein SAMN04487765_1135 [Tenacibaculum sp. MAR_2010_89]
MSKKPIKSNLFRFVTLRSPQTIEDKETGFVSFPEGQNLNNKALTAIEGIVNKEEKTTILLAAYKTGFTPYKTRSSVKAADSELYRFSLWLGRNKTNLTFENITKNLPKDGVSKRIVDFEEVMWDQLFYNIINKKSTTVRESIIQVLIGRKFLERFKNFQPTIIPKGGSPIFAKKEKEEFTRRAKASIIIPKDIIIAAQKKTNGIDSSTSRDSQKHLKSHLETALTKDRIKQYEISLKELEQAELLHKKEEKLRYESELKTYDASITQIKRDAIPNKQTLLNKEGYSKEVDVFPELQLPKFEFQEKTEISRDGDSVGNSEDGNSFSQETKKLLKSEELKKLTSFREVSSVLKEKIREEYKNILDNTPKEIEKINIGGSNVIVNPLNGVKLYSYFGGISPSTTYGYNYISMILNVGNENINVINASYTLKHSSGTTFSRTEIRKVSETNGLLSLQLFPDTGSLLPVPIGNCDFSGELTLSNGVKLSFDSSLFISKDYLVFGTMARYSGRYSGVCQVLEGGEDTGSGTTNIEETVLHGVSQLGIADFRRVEQEVCCYVPGEVSHIENIMAREYKERSTRNLNVSEQTSETTSEKEVENLTDTTSTERNELQNEVSSVVNKDKANNFGANASVSGEKFGISFSAGTNYNSSSSNSASNSNLEAQTYAQDVTERALERVVQKISTKRTSRILREYEENNTHGFDNRKGDKHVTGVYRWVDKIYKNKLINYGKRLMYEFALPEPAKFYIKEYLKFKETNNNDAITPKKPEKISITNAGQLNESNYQFYASKYNADVASPVDKSIKIGKSFVKDDQTYTANGYVFNEIDVPKGYVASKGTVNWTVGKKGSSYNWWAGTTHYEADLSIGLGSDRKTVIGGTGYSHFYNFSGTFKENIPFSFYAQNIYAGYFNVTVFCERSKETYQEWQNETYKTILDAYNDRVREYNEYVLTQNIGNTTGEKKKELSSQINRSIEKRELKRIAIDLITHPFNNIKSAGDHYKEGSNVDLKDNRKPLQEHAEIVKFFEQAFDWEIMAYTFYPYFYAEKENWKDSFEYNEGSDPIFQAFLQSGMARSVVPVRPGFEEAVNWYIKTGEIWNGQGMVTDMDDDLYVSITEEMQSIEGEVEGTWETRVPTTLTILQADSVSLNEGGLPCNPDCEESGLFSSVKTSPDGVDFDIIGQTNTVT